MLYPILGGLLIGLSATALMLLIGRIAGASGIFFHAFSFTTTEKFKEDAWRWAFLLGTIIIVPVVHFFLPIAVPDKPNGSLVLVITSGLLVGAGVGLSSGCTSGHGICGLPRFSLRSLIATVIFMLSGMITVALVQAFQS